jgi:hypothetical protein
MKAAECVDGRRTFMVFTNIVRKEHTPLCATKGQESKYYIKVQYSRHWGKMFVNCTKKCNCFPSFVHELGREEREAFLTRDGF